MFVACAVVSVLLSVILVGSGAAKLTRAARVVETLTAIGVPLGWFPWLATAEIAGGVGLILGLAVGPLGVAVISYRCRYVAVMDRRERCTVACVMNSNVPGRSAIVTVERSLHFRSDIGMAPVLVNAVPTVAGLAGASSDSRRKSPRCAAPPQTRCVRRSARMS